jgi:hypothetical protein
MLPRILRPGPGRDWRDGSALAERRVRHLEASGFVPIEAAAGDRAYL